MIYFDQASTSYPKPPNVLEEIQFCLENIGGNPGRAGHSFSIAGARVLFEGREALAALFNIADSSRIIFTLNVTEALNLALLGLLKEGDHVIASSMEHNSVMRPLRFLQGSRRVSLSIVSCSDSGWLEPGQIKKAIRPNTRLIVLIHASNVTGTIMPIGEIKNLAGEIPLLVDAAQTAGALPIDIETSGLDMLAFTGHKSLLGPTGVGGLYISQGISLEPLKRGGTGSFSEHEEQPEFLPDKYESGTPNVIGIAGLIGGLKFIKQIGVERIREHEVELTRKLLEGLEEIRGVKIFGMREPRKQVANVSIGLENVSLSELGERLDREFGIMVRVGLHCAPLAHKTIGTFPQGTLRFSMGYFNTPEEVDAVLSAVKQCVSSHH